MSKLILAACIILTVSFAGCKKDDERSPAGDAHLELYLTDAPGDYDAVLIDVQSIEIISDAGTQIYPLATPGIHNLLNLTDGKDTLLISEDITSGTVSQFRFILGENNSVVVGGIEYPLQTPSAQTSGLKINVHENLVSGELYKYVFDFDADQSIHQLGNGDYQLQPVITMYVKPL